VTGSAEGRISLPRRFNLTGNARRSPMARISLPFALNTRDDYTPHWIATASAFRRIQRELRLFTAPGAQFHIARFLWPEGTDSCLSESDRHRSSVRSRPA